MPLQMPAAPYPLGGDARGVVECTVHADNLTEPRQAKVIVERKIESIGMFDLAKAMVDACG